MESKFKDERFDYPWHRNPTCSRSQCGTCDRYVAPALRTEEAAYAEDMDRAGKTSTFWQLARRVYESGFGNAPGPRPTNRTLRPLTSEERKAAPVHGGVMLYFPDALMAVARVSKKGNDKHNPGEPLHWNRAKSMDQRECIARHLLAPDAIDPDSGEAHGAHTAWRALAALQLAEEKRLVAAGIMPLSEVAAETASPMYCIDVPAIPLGDPALTEGGSR